MDFAHTRSIWGNPYLDNQQTKDFWMNGNSVTAITLIADPAGLAQEAAYRRELERLER